MPGTSRGSILNDSHGLGAPSEALVVVGAQNGQHDPEQLPDDTVVVQRRHGVQRVRISWWMLLAFRSSWSAGSCRASNRSTSSFTMSVCEISTSVMYCAENGEPICRAYSTHARDRGHLAASPGRRW